MSNPNDNSSEVIDEVIATGTKQKDPAIKLNLGIDNINDVISAVSDPTAKAIEIAEDLGSQGGRAWFDNTVSPTSRYMMENTARGLGDALDNSQPLTQDTLKESLVETVKDRGIYSLASANILAGTGVAGGLAAREASLEQREAYLAFVESAAENEVAGYESEEFFYNGEKYTILVDATEDPDNIRYGHETSIPFVIIDEEGKPISQNLYKEIELLPDAEDLINGAIFNAGYGIMDINEASGNKPGAYDDYINDVMSDPDFVNTLTNDQAHEIVANKGLKQDNPAMWELDQNGIGIHMPTMG